MWVLGRGPIGTVRVRGPVVGVGILGRYWNSWVEDPDGVTVRSGVSGSEVRLWVPGSKVREETWSGCGDMGSRSDRK